MISKILKWLFIVQCQLVLMLLYASEGFEGGADAIQHWLISRDAPSNIMLFLNQWNKPIFTLITAPFAQFGLMGMRMFSALTGILTGITLYYIVQEKFGGLSWLPAILLFSMPKYLELLTSSMTEPLFALFLALFLLLIQRERFGWMALVAGLSPFVRQEGIALIVVGFFVLLVARRWKKVPILFVGGITMAAIGWGLSGKIDWILTSFPYNSSASEIYGSGDLFHYVKFYRRLFGNPVSILFILGGLVSLFSLKDTKLPPFRLTLLAGLLFSGLFFGAHSFVWWKGMSGSLGLIRVMACIAPAIALVGSFTIYRFLRAIGGENKTAVQVIVLTPLLALLGFEAFSITELPTPSGQANVVMRRTAEWLKSRKDVGKIHYSNPVFRYYAFQFNLEPNSIGKKSIRPSELSELDSGDVVIWDAHFSPNEGRLPLEVFLESPYFFKKKSFKPDDAFIVLGDNPYEIHVFQKVETPIAKESQTHVLINQNFDAGLDLEKNEPLLVNKGINNSMCIVTNENAEFTTIRRKFTQSESDTIVSLLFEAWINPTEPIGIRQLFLVSDITNMHYLSVDVPEISETGVGEWHHIKQSFVMPSELSESFELKCYVWNPEGLKIYIDDLKLEAISFNQPEQFETSEMNDLDLGNAIIQNAHFSANEGRLALETLLESPYFIKKKSFRPDDAFVALGNNPCEIHVFQKVEMPIAKKSQRHVVIHQDFDSVAEIGKVEYSIVDKGRNNSMCAIADKETEFITIRKSFDISGSDTIVSLMFEAWINPTEPIGTKQLFLVSDITNAHYLGVEVPQITNSGIGKWHHVSQSFVMPSELLESFELKCYLWNPEGLKVYVDDLKLEAISVNQFEQ